MTPKAVNSRHSLDSFALQLHAWKPFSPHPPDPSKSSNPKKPCRSDRSTAPLVSSPIESLSRLSLLDDPAPGPTPPRDGFRWIARKRRRRGSRSVSGRSSDRRASAACATCSDFPLVAGGTDSSGELFVHGDGVNWASDAGEVQVVEREASGSAPCQVGVADPLQGNESGYGSEPGYRGDAEFGYGDELDEEDDDGRPVFWDRQFDVDRMEIVGENKFSEQKAHHRCRRKKHEWRIIAPLSKPTCNLRSEMS